MEEDFKKKTYKTKFLGKKKTEDARVSKKKKKKEKIRKIKLSNYEKAVKKFNENQQLCGRNKVENRRITKGSLMVKAAQDGVFHKARRSFFVRKKTLNDANEARKNEDLNKIIDLGEDDETEKKQLHYHRKDENDIFKQLNFHEDFTEQEDQPHSSNLPLLKRLSLKNNDNVDENKRRISQAKRRREIRQREIFKSRSFEELSSRSSETEVKPIKKGRANKQDYLSNSEDSPRRNFKEYFHHQVRSSWLWHTNECGTSGRKTRSETNLAEETLRSHICDHDQLGFPSSTVSGSGLLKKRRNIGIEDFEDFVFTFRNALASVDFPNLRSSGVAETALRSLRHLSRMRIDMHKKQKKMREEAHRVQVDESKWKKIHDPVLSWILKNPYRGQGEQSPKASTSLDFWSTTSFHSESVCPSATTESLLQTSDTIQILSILDQCKTFTSTKSPTPQYNRRKMF